MICKNTTVVSAFVIFFFLWGVGPIGLAAYNKSDTFVLFVFSTTSLYLVSKVDIFVLFTILMVLCRCLLRNEMPLKGYFTFKLCCVYTENRAWMGKKVIAQTLAI